MKYKTIALLKEPLEILEKCASKISEVRGRKKLADYSTAINFLLEKCLIPEEEIERKMEEKLNPESVLCSFEDVAERVRLFTRAYRRPEDDLE